ncbi:hypothetical protein IV498_06660 [Paenarthrobacter sp. Z7-10]|uniref:hypothetical protein n=1 Tax=Paenarthrobacter sp. Z7-10 TaxID=2787635 RepID=UPI0022A9DE70|nr:hypothetical protein [Paenarthrobacter sp. Z7-10]MCZ2402871.1 hypothetical protein [Paenarthrobacter sp. Z7-10]
MDSQVRKPHLASRLASAAPGDGAGSVIAARHRNEHLPSDLSAISRRDLYTLSSSICHELDGEKSAAGEGS